MAVDAYGNIVIVGAAKTTAGSVFAIVRFAPDGTLDSSFGNGGTVLDGSAAEDNHATAVAIQSDGGIIVAGYSDSGWLNLARYLPDGEGTGFFYWDDVFGQSLPAAAVYSVAVQPDGKVLVGGAFSDDGSNQFGVARFNADGSYDGDFGASSDGIAESGVANSTIRDMLLAPDGSIIAAGMTGDNVPVLARITAGEIGGASVSVVSTGAALPLSGADAVAAGDTYTLTLASPLPLGEGQGEGGQGEGVLGSGTDVSYTINWNDGTDPTTIDADDLAAAGDQVTHVFNAATSGITVDLVVGASTYSSVGSLPVYVDTSHSTTVGLELDDSSPGFGSTVTLTATVSPAVSGQPGGTVDFFEGTMYLGTQTLDESDYVQITTPPLASGAHSFTAVYNGDGVFDPSTSDPAAATVGSPSSGTPALTGDSTAAEGDYTLGLPSDVGTDTITEWGIDWGDGTTLTDVTDLSTHSASHPYGAAGSYTITAVALGGSGSYEATKAVTITHAGPSSLSLSVGTTTGVFGYSGADTMDGGSARRR